MRVERKGEVQGIVREGERGGEKGNERERGRGREREKREMREREREERGEGKIKRGERNSSSPDQMTCIPDEKQIFLLNTVKKTSEF